MGDETSSKFNFLLNDTIFVSVDPLMNLIMFALNEEQISPKRAAIWSNVRDRRTLCIQNELQCQLVLVSYPYNTL